MAERRDTARRKRLWQARIGAAVAGVVVIASVAWIVVAMTGTEPADPPPPCQWNDIRADLPAPTAGATPTLPEGTKDVGLPPTEVPHSGFQVLTLATNQGTVKIEMDLAKAPCTAASIAYLAGKGFYDNTSCHRLVDGIFALQCGDPSGTGTGGATYRFADEYKPVSRRPTTYYAGEVAMAHSSQPDSNGSQFFFIYSNSQLDASYSLWGRVIEGFDVVTKVAAGGDDGAFNDGGGGGHPKIQLTFTSVTAGPITPKSVATAPPPSAPSGSPDPSGSPAPSGTLGPTDAPAATGSPAPAG